MAEIQMTDRPVPSAQDFFHGDINEAVISVQKVTGIQITPEWWSKEVGNHGTPAEILNRFDEAYRREVDRKRL